VIEIDTLVEIWKAEAIARRAEDLLARVRARHAASEHGDLSWWREACACLRPTAEDDAILEDEESGEQQGG
jgi:hypothetical protein